MGRRMKEIKQVYLYDYDQTMGDYADEEEEADQIQMNAVKEGLRLLLLFQDSNSNSNSAAREEALSTIIKALEDGSPYYNNKIVDSYTYYNNNQIVYNYSFFVLLFDQCIISIEKGSSKEVSLAAYIIGFLALSTAHLGRDVASAILHKSLPLIHKRLKLPMVIDSTKTVSLLNCLAIINFVVGSNQDQEVVEEEPSSDVIWRKVTIILGDAKSSALLAFGFLLTSVNRPATIDDKIISYLLSVLDCDESRVRAISAQVLALIFETYALTDDLREKVLHRVNYRLSSEQSKCQWKVFMEVAEFLEHGYSPISKRKDTTRRRKDELYVQTSSWADLMRLEFLKQFLGKKGFAEHMQKNEFLQAILKVPSSPDEAEETSIGSAEKRDENYIRMGKQLVHGKKLRVMNNKRRILNKERTRSLEKSRMMKAATAGWML